MRWRWPRYGCCKAIGIWDRVAENAQPMLEIKVTDGRAGEGPSPFLMHFDHAEIEEGPMGHMVEDRFLRRAFLQAMSEEKAITHLSGQEVTEQEVTPTGVTVTLASGKTLSGRLLVGSDGRTSGTARRAGITRTGWGYGQTALVCAIEHELPHNGIAHQFFMPPGPLAILPLPGNVSSIVWSETEETAAPVQRPVGRGLPGGAAPPLWRFSGRDQTARQAVYLSAGPDHRQPPCGRPCGADRRCRPRPASRLRGRV